jgi:hypothetical protein
LKLDTTGVALVALRGSGVEGCVHVSPVYQETGSIHDGHNPADAHGSSPKAGAAKTVRTATAVIVRGRERIGAKGRAERDPRYKMIKKVSRKS